MKVRGDLQPSNAFTLEEQPKRPGFALVRFYENAVPFTEEKDGLTVSGWEYDEYHLELADTGDLENDVLNNFDTLLAQAKEAEASDMAGDLEARVEALEQYKADREEVEAVWSQMAAAYSEGVSQA